MPSPSSDRLVPKVNFTCSRHGCNNSRMSGADMRLCVQCKGVNYCGRECQRADWGAHKAWCKSQAARMAQEEEEGIAGPRVDCNAWMSAMGVSLFQWICIHGLGLASSQNSARLKTHFVVLTLRERRPRPSNFRKLFTHEGIEVFPRSELRAVLGQDKMTLETLEQDHREDAAARARGSAGRALLVVNVLGVDSDRILLSHIMGVILDMNALLHPPFPEWKVAMKDLIDEGTNIKRQAAKMKKAEELRNSGSSPTTFRSWELDI
ncbi:hypothetical protein C8R46DRAFT_437009 [Mycena filopes]|nr:hypothetical protein C8R46DRAFT_437009 [Mycena filopes]